MRRNLCVLAAVTPAVLLAIIFSSRDSVTGKDDPAPVRKATGIDKRVPWTTSNVKGSPEPPPPYKLVRAFPKLKFTEPLEMAFVPHKKAWFVLERGGKIFMFDTDPNTEEKKLVLDVGRGSYGMALHPQFEKNGFIYISNMPPSARDTADGSRVSRYKIDPAKMQGEASSEKIILTWPRGGHNGGCLRFGPDGYLYLVTGDGSGIADQLETGQNINDLLASILRIDVDKTDGDKAYRIPDDNPFVKTAGARGEVYAYGLRQVWKMSFDTATGDLWGGEVGQDLWEMVYKIEKGGNYGWSVSEGNHPFRPERKKGPSPILKPIVEHNHFEFRSITGGFIYHGKRLPELKGAYIYGDYDTGRAWMLKYDGKVQKVTENKELAKSTLRIVAWGQDAEGEVLALDFIQGGIYQLNPSPPAPADAPKFPRKLSETGLFTSTKDMTPTPGLIPYSVNAELWSDGATKDRYIAIPGSGKVEYETMTYPQPAPGSVPGWRFPDNTVLVKNFYLELEPGNPKSRRRLETRLLHGRIYPGTEEVGDQVWSGYTYIWNDTQTDAELADAKGVDRQFTIKDAKAPGGERQQTWHFPSRVECNMCHTVTAKYALGLNTAQMNKDHNYNGVIANQMSTLEHIGLFDRKLPATPDKLPKLVDYHDTKADINDRARAYMHANCSHCHRKWGGGNAEFQLLATLPLKETGTDVKPAHGNFDLKDPLLLVPGHPERSMIHHRMTRLGLGRMPHIASTVVDQEGVKLIEEWIKGLK
jgi:uncharacterized repeat protein (TIGR03806 family)